LPTVFHNVKHESGSKMRDSLSGLWPVTRPGPKSLTLWHVTRRPVSMPAPG